MTYISRWLFQCTDGPQNASVDVPSSCQPSNTGKSGVPTLYAHDTVSSIVSARAAGSQTRGRHALLHHRALVLREEEIEVARFGIELDTEVADAVDEEDIVRVASEC